MKLYLPAILTTLILLITGQLYAQQTALLPDEQMPVFKEKNEKKYLDEHIEYPEFALDNGITGRVTVRFIIDEQGNVTQVYVKNSVHSTVDTALMKCVMGMPKWKPGIQKGKPVKVYFSQSATFAMTGRDMTGEIRLDSANGYFLGPRGDYFQKFPEFAGNIDDEFTTTTPGLRRGVFIKVLATIDETGKMQHVRILSKKTKVPEADVIAFVNKTSTTPDGGTRWKPAIHCNKNSSCDIVITVWFKKG